jgi:flagellar biosynthesis protein FlhB
MARTKTENATPFILRKARGLDLCFAGSLLTVALLALVVGERFAGTLAQLVRYSLTARSLVAADPLHGLDLTGATYRGAFEPLVVLGVLLIAVLVTLELMQRRGFISSIQPLKPDFHRLNPATGIKRLALSHSVLQHGSPNPRSPLQFPIN